MHIEQTHVVKASREQVFQAFTDYESWPKWSSFFLTVTAKRDGNTAHLDIEANLRGRRVKRTENYNLTPPEQARVEGQMEGLTNTSVWRFEHVPEGTRVTSAIDAQLPWRFRVLGPLAKRQFQGLVRETLREFAKYVEAK